MGGRVLGIDASVGMISKAKEYQTKNLEFRELDINDMDFEDIFTVIVSNTTLHRVNNFAGKGNCPNFIDVAKNRCEKKNTGGILRISNGPGICPGRKITKRQSIRDCFEKEMIKWIEQPFLVPFLKNIAKKK